MGWFDFLRRPGAGRDRVAIEIDLGRDLFVRTMMGRV